MVYKEIFDLWQEKATADPDIMAELVAIEGNQDEIEDRFYRELEFGTGGLRGVIGAGTNRMNVYVVSRATQGYCNYLKRHDENPSVAIAYDSRIKSRLFAEASVGVFAANGIRAHIFPRLMPTPALSFAVRQLDCSGGVVITASHNPAKYNGYKVYGPDGCQITTQTAEDILACINTVDVFEDVRTISFEEGLKKGLVFDIREDTVAAYLQKVSKESLLGRETNKDISIIYTPLNGAGISCVPQCLEANGFTRVAIPEAQREPDGNFPTCPYPNPEIKEALAVAIACAKQTGGELVLATDPDCDRVGAAVKTGEGYILINGNQMGVLLLDFVCRMKKEAGIMPERPVAIKTIVTTEMAENIAAHYGVQVINTLTGFKFIGEQIGYLEAKGEENRYIFGFEESYGYLSSTAVRDKDAVNASLLICEMFAWYKARHMTLLDALDTMYEEYNCYVEKLLSYGFEGSAGFGQMQKLMAALRENLPQELAGLAVERVADYNCEGTGLPKSDVVQFRMEGGSVATVRPSGTEPKLKVYLSVCGKTLAGCSDTIRKLENWFNGWVH